MNNNVLQEIREALKVATTAEVISFHGLVDYDVLDIVRDEADKALQKLDAYIADNGEYNVKCNPCDASMMMKADSNGDFSGYELSPSHQ